MKNKKNVLLVGIFVIIIAIGLISTSIALEDPEYSETIAGGHAFEISEIFNEGEVVRIEYEITGGDADLHLYIRNSTGNMIKDFGNIIDYGIFYFYVPYNDTFRIIFKNDAWLTPRDVEINIDVVKTLTITSPISTDIFLTGDNTIVWTSTGDISYVQLQLYKNGDFLETITSGIFNTDSYSWYIYNDEYTNGSDYQIKIMDYYNNTISDYSNYFTIGCEIEKTITITTPKSTNTFSSGYNYITWTTTGDISSYIRIDLYKNGDFLETITSGIFNTDSYSWYIYDDAYVDGSYYQIKILESYDHTIYDFSDYFTIKCETEDIPDEPYIPDDKPIFSIKNLIFFIIIPIVIIVGVVLAIVIPVVIHKKHKKRISEVVEPIEKSEVKEIETLEITHCPTCGSKIKDKLIIYCSECGTKLK